MLFYFPFLALLKILQYKLIARIRMANPPIKYFLILTTLLLICDANRIPVQAHSFNDLDYIVKYLSRSIDVYKMDVSMANRQSCQKYSSWNKSQPCVKVNQYIQQICCLAMRGDGSSRPYFDYPFNTSTQYSKMLDTALAKIVINQPRRRIIFAINFQYHHTFGDSITQNFLSQLADLMLKYPKNVLLGTGSDSFILEYDRICYGKGAPECTAARRKISQSNMFLQSGGRNPFDPRDYYKRFRNFNVHYKQVDTYCKQGFPQWIDNYPQFPLIFWQPSDQNQVQRVISQFTSPSCMKKHGRNLSSFAMATNMDPEMMDIYIRKTIQSTSFSDWLVFGKQPKLANISWTFNTEKILISDQVNYRLTKITRGNSQIVYSASTNIYTNKLLLQKWQYSSTTKLMQVTINRQFASLFSNGETVQTLLHDKNLHLILISYRNTSSNKQYKIYYFNIQTLQMVSYKDISDPVYATVMRQNQLIYVTCDNSLQLSNCYIKGMIQFQQTKTYARFSLKLLIGIVSGIQQTKNGFLIVGQSANKKGVSVAVLIQNGEIIPTPIVLSYGTNPKIIRKQNGNGKQYAVLLQNAMCHCGTLLNHNNANKCVIYNQQQYISLRNVRGIINMLQFNLQDIRKNSQIISPCMDKFNLYKIMIGANTDFIQLNKLNSFMISSQYVRVEDQDIMVALFCGSSGFQKEYKYKQRSSFLTGMYFTNYIPQLQPATHTQIQTQ